MVRSCRIWSSVEIFQTVRVIGEICTRVPSSCGSYLLNRHLYLHQSKAKLLLLSHISLRIILYVSLSFAFIHSTLSTKTNLGVGYGQVASTGIVATYYATIMAITLHYFFNSFKSTLPWTKCLDEWGDTCRASSPDSLIANFSINNRSSSAELYYE